MEFTHFDHSGNAHMVDVTEKDVTNREAAACGCIKVSREVHDAIIGQKIKKGDVLTVAQVAGIMGTKKTSELIPMCHKLNLTGAAVTFEIEDTDCNKPSEQETGDTVGNKPSEQETEDTGCNKPSEREIEYADCNKPSKQDYVIIKAVCRVKTEGKTGVEMEALTGVSVALLTIYDMCKSIDKAMVISDIHLIEKSGGKSGNYKSADA